MDFLSSILPITALTAIVLFVIKEFVEWWRRWRGNVRRRDAFRRLLARECELNYWALKKLREALKTMENHPLDNYSISRRANEVRFKHSSSAGHGASWLLSPVHMEQALKLMLDVATIDNSLFVHLETAYDELNELAHVRQSLINVIEERDFLHREGLAEYGLETLDDVEVALQELYRACTGKEELEPRLR